MKRSVQREKAEETLARESKRVSMRCALPHARKLNQGLKRMSGLSVKLLCIRPPHYSKQAGAHGMLTLSEFRWMMRFWEFQALHNDNAASLLLFPKCPPTVLAPNTS